MSKEHKKITGRMQTFFDGGPNDGQPFIDPNMEVKRQLAAYARVDELPTLGSITGVVPDNIEPRFNPTTAYWSSDDIGHEGF